MSWTFILVTDTCDCFDLPDGAGGTIPAPAIQTDRVAMLAVEFCTVATTADFV